MAAKKKKAKVTGPEFNHAMVYTADIGRAVQFYRDLLGFKVVDEYRPGYARLVSPGGRTTIALHLLDRAMSMDPANEGIRLYFEIKNLDKFCAALVAKGVVFDEMPNDKPWGWRHAYLRDPDGHELSLYWAGQKRLRKTTPVKA
jgi:catechol 2,3-dioxygenase-like lactoylglutathione lyase family enzyme